MTKLPERAKNILKRLDQDEFHTGFSRMQAVFHPWKFLFHLSLFLLHRLYLDLFPNLVKFKLRNDGIRIHKKEDVTVKIKELKVVRYSGTSFLLFIIKLWTL